MTRWNPQHLTTKQQASNKKKNQTGELRFRQARSRAASVRIDRPSSPLPGVWLHTGAHSAPRVRSHFSLVFMVPGAVGKRSTLPVGVPPAANRTARVAIRPAGRPISSATVTYRTQNRPLLSPAGFHCVFLSTRLIRDGKQHHVDADAAMGADSVETALVWLTFPISHHRALCREHRLFLNMYGRTVFESGFSLHFPDHSVWPRCRRTRAMTLTTRFPSLALR